MSDEKKNIDTDYEYARRTYYDVIERGREGLEEMIEVAKASEHPRAYEVLSKMIKDIGDVTDKLLQLNKGQQELKEPKPKPGELPSPDGGTTNNFFVGTTSELQAILRQQQQEMKDVTPDEPQLLIEQDSNTDV